MKTRIELGDIAKDTISGFEGVVIASTFWLYGCERLTLQPKKLDKDGQIRQTQCFDADQCVLVKKATKRTPMAEKLRALADTGGPRPAPKRHADPKR